MHPDFVPLGAEEVVSEERGNLQMLKFELSVTPVGDWIELAEQNNEHLIVFIAEVTAAVARECVIRQPFSLRRPPRWVALYASWIASISFRRLQEQFRMGAVPPKNKKG